MRQVSVLWVSLVILWLGSCGQPGHFPVLPPEAPAPGGGATGGATAAGAAPPTWDNAIQGLVQARCSFCHNPRNANAQMPNYTDYRVAYERRDRILFRVAIKKDMPMAPYNALITDQERELFATWARAGAPKGAASLTGDRSKDGVMELRPPEIDAVPGLGAAMREAMRDENLSAVDRLIASWGYAKSVDEQGRSPLISIIVQTETETPALIKVVGQLLKNGASPNADWRGVPVLIWALRKNFQEVALALISANADVNATVHSVEAIPEWSGYNVLMAAIEKQQIRVIESLFLHGVQADYALPNGTSPTSLANKISDPELKNKILGWLHRPPNPFE